VLGFANSTSTNIVFALTASKHIYYYNGGALAIYKTLPERLNDNAQPYNYVSEEKEHLYFGKEGYSLNKFINNETFGLVRGLSDTSNTNPLTHIYGHSGYIYLVKKGAVLQRFQGANKENAEITTSVITDKIDAVKIGYQELPIDTDIKIYTRIDGDTAWTAQETIVDRLKQQVRTKNAIDNESPVQVRVELVPFKANTPVITYIDIL
jgi:hypothetical protein